jgi:hypothetical protein
MKKLERCKNVAVFTITVSGRLPAVFVAAYGHAA